MKAVIEDMVDMADRLDALLDEPQDVVMNTTPQDLIVLLEEAQTKVRLLQSSINFLSMMEVQ